MNILQIDYQSSSAGEQLVQSFQETGFAVIKNHPVSHDLFKKVKEEWTQFFDSKAKFDYLYDTKACPQDGYFPGETAKGHDIKDIKEFYHIYPGGRFPAGLSDLTWQLRQALLDMGVKMLQWLEDFTPESVKQHFSQPLPEMVDTEKQTCFRILHYPPHKGDEVPGAIRAAAHGDINLITVLPASDESGLQAKDLNGEWHTVPCDPGMMVINVGDMLEMASSHYYQSTQHRVVNPQDNRKHVARFSFPLFIHPKNEVVLDTKHHITAGDYLLERLTELGLRGEAATA